MITKVCFRCGKEKPLSQYYKHSQMSDGHLNKCKSCTKADSKKRHERIISTFEGLEKERARHREKYHRLGYREKHKPSKESKLITMNKYREKYPEKYTAKNKSQKIKKEGFENHHWSYNEEHYKDVIFLTKEHHMFLHRFISYDQERMMYRCTRNIGCFYAGDLLDTKKRHKEYFDLCLVNFSF